MEFTPNSCSSKCPRTAIYRLGVRMSVRKILPGSRPDGGPWPSGRDKSFLYKNIVQTGWLDRLDGRTSAVSNFHNRLRASRPGGGVSGRLNFNTQFPYQMRVCPDHEGETSGRLKSNQQLPYTMHQGLDHSCQMSGRFILNCDSCLTEIRVRTGYHIVRTVD
jgi:hypothetical protein